MQLILYSYTGPNNKINKAPYLSGQWGVTGNLVAECDVLNPQILINKGNPTRQNYAYIPDFNRFYYMKSESVRTNYWLLKMSVDPLYTYMDEIYQNKAIIDKTANDDLSNLYLDDGTFVTDSRKYNQLKMFPSGLNTSPTTILIAAGGAS